MTSIADGIEPYGYQLDDMKFLITEKKGALLHEPGVGKTFGALLALTYAIETEGGQALVVMPPILLTTWYDKLHEYFDTDLKALVYRGPPTKREAFKLENYDIVFVSFDLFHRDYDRFRAIKWLSLTVDESKYVKVGVVTKSKKTQRMNKFGCVQSVAFRTKYVTLMNGTPLTKSPEDVFHIFQLINPNIYVTKKNFLNKHARYLKGDLGYPQIVGWKWLPAMQHLLDKISRRMIKSEVLKDLPPKRLIVKQFDLEESHQKNLKELWDFGFLDLQEEKSELMFLEGMGLMMRVRQAMIDPNIVGVKKKSAYFEALDNLLDDLGDEQFIIFAHFHNTIDMLREHLDARKIKTAELHGRITEKHRDTAVTDFKAKKTQAMLANPKSAGVGLDFQQARNVIFFELDYEVDSFWQGQDRVHRPGQKEDVNIYVFVARNTPAVALLRSVKTNVDYVAEVLKGREDSKVFFDNKVTIKEEQEWNTII